MNSIEQQRLEFRRFSSQASEAVERYSEEFDECPESDKLRIRFVSLRLQVAIFAYEFSLAMEGVVGATKGSLSRKVALKDVIHKTYELKGVITRSLIKEITDLAVERGLGGQAKRLAQRYRDFKGDLAKIERFSSLRNAASGHYDRDSRKFLSEIQRIDEDSAVAAVLNVQVFFSEIIRISRDIGRLVDYPSNSGSGS